MKLSDESRDLKSETQPSRLIGRVEIETISQVYSRPEVGRVIVLDSGFRWFMPQAFISAETSAPIPFLLPDLSLLGSPSTSPARALLALVKWNYQLTCLHS